MNIKMTKYHHECSICHTPFEYGDIKVFRGDDESRFCYYCAAKAAAMFETTSALIGNVTEVENGWEVAFAPDCTTPKVLPLAGLAASREQPVVGGLN